MKYFEWDEPGIGRNLTYMLFTGIVCFAVLLIIEYRLLASIVYAILSLFKQQLPPETEDGYLDDDILAEKQRVNAMSDVDIGVNNLVMKKVSKFYGKYVSDFRLSNDE